MKKLSLTLLAKTVAERRKELKLTQVQLAELTGINRSVLSRLESGDYTPSVDQLLALSEALSFDMTPRVVEAADRQGKYVECGPLLMAYPVPTTVTEDTNTYSNMNGKVPGDGFKCWSMKPSGDFNYAINTEDETLTLNIDEEKLANGYPFDLDSTPISVSLPVRPITWTLEKDRYNPVLPASENVVLKGSQRNIDLVPYGAAKLRVAVFPDVLRKRHKTLTDSLLVNPDFEMTSSTAVNHGGIEKKTYKPYGWNVRGTLNGSKAHLEIPQGSTTSRSFIGFDASDATRLVNNEQRIVNNEWFTLDGRRIANGQKPTARGLYIHNGRKEVVQ